MKITKSLVKMFKETEKNSGTEVALKNILWILAGEILTDIGVKKINTSYKANKAKYINAKK